MPLYDYKCSRCGTVFERLVRRSDADKPQRCPNCGSTETKRVMSACAVRSSGRVCAPSGG